MLEQWKDIPGWEGYYQCSSLGKVRGLDRIVPHETFGSMRIAEKELTPTLDKDGYAYVSFSRYNVSVRKYLHHLVAETFLGPRPEGMHVLHGPNRQKDNSLSNVRYGTPSENMLDTLRDGTNWQSNKEECPNGHELKLPNLVAAEFRRGRRNCLACSRGRNVRTHEKSRGVVLSEIQLIDLCNEFYERILSGDSSSLRRSKLKEFCIREHILDSPNLVPSDLKKDKRKCLACSRAIAKRNNHKSRKGIEYSEEAIQRMSDEYYKEIMEN